MTTIVTGQYRPEVIRALVGLGQLAVGVSYHFALFALTQGLPCFSMYENEYYRLKLTGLYEHFGKPEWVVPFSETAPDAVLDAAVDAMENRPAIEGELLKHSQAMADGVNALLDEIVPFANAQAGESAATIGPDLLSVVICTHNRSALLAKCLDGLSAQDGIGGCRVMVVDNNSTDDTAEVCESYARSLPCFSYVFESTPGLSAARNRGLAECDTELIAYLDDDAIPEPGWLAAMLRAFEKTGADAVGGRIVPYWEGRRPWWISSGLYHLLSGVDLGTDVRALDDFYPTGANMAFRTDKLRQIGGFDVSLGMHSVAGKDATAYLGEETKIGMALSQIGSRTAYSGEAAVRHYADGSRCRLGALRARARQVGRTCALLGWPHTDMSAYDDEYVWAIGCAASSALRLHPRDAVAFYLSAVIAGSASRELSGQGAVRPRRALDVARAALRLRRGLLGLVRRTLLGPGIAPNA